MEKNEFGINGEKFSIQGSFRSDLSSPSWQLGFWCPFTFMPKFDFSKNESFSKPRFEPTTSQIPSTIHNHSTNSYFMIIFINLGVYHSLITPKHIIREK